MRRSIIPVVLFVLLLVLFYGLLPYQPRFALETEVNEPAERTNLEREVVGLSDDGSRAFIGQHKYLDSDFSHRSLNYELWDLKTSRNVTPSFWAQPEWQRLFANLHNESITSHLMRQSSGQRFITDPAKWDQLCARMAARRARQENLSRQQGDASDRNSSMIFLDATWPSVDGEFSAYPVHCNLPLFGSVTATVVEKTMTGERVACLPTAVDWIIVGPGGKTACSAIYADAKAGKEGEFILWDLTSCQALAELEMSERSYPVAASYSRDGQFLVACFAPDSNSPTVIHCWEMKSGRQGCRIQDGGCFLDTRICPEVPDLFLSKPPDPHDTPSYTSGLASMVDVASVKKIQGWRDGLVSEKGFDVSADGNFAAVNANDFRLRPSGVSHVDAELSAIVSNRPIVELVRLLDLRDGRVVHDFQGTSSKFSENGQWLATWDREGVIRVWHIPLRKPWWRIIGAAALGTLIVLLFKIVVRRIIRLCKRTKATNG